MTSAGGHPPPLIELALAYFRQPLRFPRLGRMADPLPAGFAPLLPAFGQALAPSKIEATAAALGATQVELVAAARFFLRHALLAPGASPWRVLGLEGPVSPAQVRQHYQWLIRLFHPDRHGADPLGLDQEADTADAMRINAAHEQVRHWVEEGAVGGAPVLAPRDRDPEALRLFFQPQEWPLDATAKGKGKGAGQGVGHYPPGGRQVPLRWRLGPRLWMSGLAVLVAVLGLLWALPEPPARLKVAAEGDKSAPAASPEVPPRRYTLEPQQPQPAYLTQPRVSTPAQAEAEAKAAVQAQRAAAAEVEARTRAEAEAKAAVQAQRAAAAEVEARTRAEAEAKEQARLAAQREAESQARMVAEVAEREALERQLSAERLEQARELEAQRLAYQHELEAQRLAHQRELEAQRQAQEAKAKQPTSPLEEKSAPLPPDPTQVVHRLTSAYGAGALEALVGLFTPDAKTTDGQGRKFIRADYQNLFATTSHREFNITGLRWDWREDGRTVGTGALTVRARAKGSTIWHQAEGRISLELVPWEGDWRIARMEYQLQ